MRISDWSSDVCSSDLTAAKAALATQSLRQALKEASGHTGFWLLTAGFFVCGFHLAFISVHLPAYLSDKGMPPWLAAATLALIGLCNMIGTYSCGVLGERFPKKSVLSLLSLARGLNFLRSEERRVGKE